MVRTEKRLLVGPPCAPLLLFRLTLGGQLQEEAEVMRSFSAHTCYSKDQERDEEGGGEKQKRVREMIFPSLIRKVR